MRIQKRLDNLEERGNGETVIMHSCLDGKTPEERRRENEAAGPNATILESSLIQNPTPNGGNGDG